MENIDRTSAFLDVFRSGMVAKQDRDIEKVLGDRSSYLGLSDLAKYQECPRAAVAEKFNGKSDELSTLLTLNRGHWFEEGVAGSFAALGLKEMRQLEVFYTYNDVPIKGHMDIVLVWEKPFPAVRILEIKSMDKLPQQPYTSHVWQITAQTELVKYCWNNPVFSVSEKRKLSFPQLCREKFSINLPETVQDCSVEGWLLCLSMTDALAYGPFNADAEFLQNLNISAVTMWSQIEHYKTQQIQLNDIPVANGFYPLCCYCDANGDCPKFSDCSMQSQWESAISKLDQLKENRVKLELEIKEIENGLKLAYQNSGLDGWINTEQHRFKLINSKGRLIFDKSILASELKRLFNALGLISFDAELLISKCERESAPSSRLTIQPIKKGN